MMKKLMAIYLGVAAIFASGCASMRNSGISLYDNADIVVTSTNPLLIPQDIDKAFVQNVRTRLQQQSETNVSARGDMKPVSTCGPRTVKIASDIASLSINNATEYSGSFFRPRGTSTTKQDIRMTLAITVEDCETGKVIESFTKTEKGEDLMKIISSLSRDVGGASYDYRYERRSK